MREEIVYSVGAPSHFRSPAGNPTVDSDSSLAIGHSGWREFSPLIFFDYGSHLSVAPALLPSVYPTLAVYPSLLSIEPFWQAYCTRRTDTLAHLENSWLLQAEVTHGSVDLGDNKKVQLNSCTLH